MQLATGNRTNLIFLSFSILYFSLGVNAQTIRGLEFSICRGESVSLTSPRFPPSVIKIIDENATPISDPKGDPEAISTLDFELTESLIDYYCNPPVLSVKPDTNWTLDENGGIVLSPYETTEYKIRYLSVDQCPNGPLAKVTVNVACNAQHNKIAEDFLWLDNLLNDDGCGISHIDVYEKNGSKFVYVEALSGKALYYQDGSILCTDATLCLNFYDLSNKKNTWSCKQLTENENAAIQIFNNYTWLEKLVDKENCIGETISVYDTGTYTFIVVYDAINGYKLYDNTGLYWYFSANGFNFLDEYEPFRIHNWACDGNFSGRKGFSEEVSTNVFQLFPNPAKGKIFISLDKVKTNIYNEPIVNIYDVSGQQLLQVQPQANDFFVQILELDVSDLSKGMYLVELQLNDNFSFEKLVIE